MYVCGDRPHESLIFQHVPHIGPAATPNSGLIACFSPVGDACPEFIFNSFLVEDGRYRAVCMRYVYLNPVRAGMVKHAADYAWSWIATSDGASAGAVPEERLMRRVAQIGAGKIFGSLAFVTATAFALGDRFRSRSVAAREVGELGYATHGWRLAKAAERAV